MFHVKQFEDDGRFESRYGQVLSGLGPGLRRLLGWCATLFVLPTGRVVRLLGVERLFHVKHIFMGMVSVPVVASRLGRRLIL